MTAAVNRRGKKMTKKIKIAFVRNNGEWEVDGKPAKNHKSDCPKGDGPFDIEFSVGTPTGLYQFTEDPIWIRRIEDESDEQCPSSFAYPEIFSYEMKGLRILVLHNENSEETPTNYRYQLNVWDTHKKEYVNIDPVLTNGGRG
jgi:hypothetical protein